MNEDASTPAGGGESAFRRFSRKPRAVLGVLAVWSMLAALTQIFVNSGLFLDIHDNELDGALGGMAFGLNAVPLAAVYLYCARNPTRHPNVFWLAFIHQGVMFAAMLYHLGVGTFSLESIIAPAVGSALLAGVSFLQIFEPKSQVRT